MKKSDYTYLVIYIVLASLGTLFSTHLFDDHVLQTDFYIYYTNLSNYFCLGIAITALCVCNKIVDKPMPRWLNTLIVVGAQLILITFLVYNLLLADFSFALYWTNMYNLLFHVVLPVMFVGFAIARCSPVGLWGFILPTAVQFFYIFVVWLRSLALGGAANRIVYPYFFLNFATLGMGQTIKWLVVMLLVSLLVSCILWLSIWLKQKFCPLKTKNL